MGKVDFGTVKVNCLACQKRMRVHFVYFSNCKGVYKYKETGNPMVNEILDVPKNEILERKLAGLQISISEIFAHKP